MAMTNATEIQHMRDAITDASKQSHATPLTDDYIDPTCFSGSVNILASSLTGSETDYNCHQNDFVTHIQSLRHPGNQEICDTQTGDITVPASCPKNSAEYRAAYLSGIHPELNVYTPDGQYCQGTMFHHPGTESMTTTAGCQNPSYCLQGTGVTWNDTSVVHNYGTACIQFQCGGYVSPNTEWSFDGADNYTPGTTYICNFDSSNKLQTCVTCSGYYAAGSFAQTLPKGNVTASSMLSGYCAYNSAGTLVTGSIQYSKLYSQPTFIGNDPSGCWEWDCKYWDHNYSSGPASTCYCCCQNFNRFFYASDLMPITVCLCSCVTYRYQSSFYTCCIEASGTCTNPFAICSVCTSYYCTGSVTIECICLRGWRINENNAFNKSNSMAGTPTAIRLSFCVYTGWTGGTGTISQSLCKPIIWSCFNIPSSP